MRKLARKIDLYVIVSSEEDAEKIPVRCYLMRKNFLNGLFDSDTINQAMERSGNTKLMLASDRNTILNINEDANGVNGMVMRMDDSFLVGLALETLLQNIVKL